MLPAVACPDAHSISTQLCLLDVQAAFAIAYGRGMGLMDRYASMHAE